MRTRIARALFAATLAAIAAIAACSYAPNPESGTLMCGPASSCPENYSCRSRLLLSRRRGHRRRWGGGGGAAAARRPGGAGGGDPKAKFIGQWNFVSPAKRMRNCPPTVVNER